MTAREQYEKRNKSCIQSAFQQLLHIRATRGGKQSKSKSEYLNNIWKRTIWKKEKVKCLHASEWHNPLRCITSQIFLSNIQFHGTKRLQRSADAPTDGPLSGKQEMFFAQRPAIKCCFTLTTVSWGLHRVFGSKRRLRKKKIIWSFRKIVGDNYKTVVHNHYSLFPLDETSVRRKQGVFPRLSSHSSSSCSIPAKNNHMFSLIFNHTFLFSTSGQIPSLPQRNWVVVTCIFKDYSGFDKHKLGICQIWGAIKNSICCAAIKKKKRPVVYIKVNNVPFELNQQKKKDFLSCKL